MKQYLAVLGHQPHISLAELEIRYGQENIEKYSKVALLSVEPNIRILGGSPKVARTISIEKKLNLDEIFVRIDGILADHIKGADRKVNIGISYLINTPFKEIEPRQRQLIKVFKEKHGSVRFIPNRDNELNTAQVWHNKLLLEPHIELLVVECEAGIIFAQTTGVQNIKGYTIRDRSKPVRDAKNGMLPPKLARSMLSMANLAEGARVLDPFCGTGTVLMEALLDGYSVTGTDVSDNMVEASRANLDWLAHNMKLDFAKVELEVGDARKHQWENIDAVVAETYLGPPLRSLPNEEKLLSIRSNVDDIVSGALANLATQLKPGARLVLAVPAWALPENRGYLKLKTVDELPSLGYNLVDLKLADSKELIYYRPNQVVARQLLILRKEDNVKN